MHIKLLIPLCLNQRFFAPVSIFATSQAKTHATTRLLLFNCPLPLPDFHQNRKVSTSVLIISSIKFSDNPFGCYCCCTCGTGKRRTVAVLCNGSARRTPELQRATCLGAVVCVPIRSVTAVAVRWYWVPWYCSLRYHLYQHQLQR